MKVKEPASAPRALGTEQEMKDQGFIYDLSPYVMSHVKSSSSN